MRWAAFIICLLFADTSVLANRSVQSFTANYRLTFNGDHVGDARFSLKLTTDNQYSFEAFTRPAGKMSADNTLHEVFEASSGMLLGGMPVPDHYYTAVKTDSGTDMLEFFYDWKTMTLTRKSDNGQQKAKLKKQSQDRLSYLLNAMKLAGGHRNSVIVPLITGAGTKQLSIRKKNRRHINTKTGRVLAQELELSYGIESPDRSLWLSLDDGYLPVLLEQKTDKGIVRMEIMQVLTDSQ
jgi:hypothetical protein